MYLYPFIWIPLIVFIVYFSSKEIRFSQVGMWNDCSTMGFRAPKPSFISRTYSPRDNYEKHMFGDKKKTKAE